MTAFSSKVIKTVALKQKDDTKMLYEKRHIGKEKCKQKVIDKKCL